MHTKLEYLEAARRAPEDRSLSRTHAESRAQNRSLSEIGTHASLSTLPEITVFAFFKIPAKIH